MAECLCAIWHARPRLIDRSSLRNGLHRQRGTGPPRAQGPVCSQGRQGVSVCHCHCPRRLQHCGHLRIQRHRSVDWDVGDYAQAMTCRRAEYKKPARAGPKIGDSGGGVPYATEVCCLQELKI